MGDCVADHKEDSNMNELMDSMGIGIGMEDTSNSVSDIQLDSSCWVRNSASDIQISDSSYCWIKYNEAELKQLLLYAAIELDSVRASAQSQRQAHENLIKHLEELVQSAKRERDEMREQCINLTNQLAAHYINAGSVARTDDSCKFDITTDSSMLASCMNSLITADDNKARKNLNWVLPERGKFVEAVMRAGPLLQTLLVAGPLPQWRYPPPLSSAIHGPPPQLITPLATNAAPPSPSLRYNEFCTCCCNYINNNNTGGFVPPSTSNVPSHLPSPWEADQSI